MEKTQEKTKKKIDFNEKGRDSLQGSAIYLFNTHLVKIIKTAAILESSRSSDCAFLFLSDVQAQSLHSSVRCQVSPLIYIRPDFVLHSSTCSSSGLKNHFNAMCSSISILWSPLIINFFHRAKIHRMEDVEGSLNFGAPTTPIRPHIPKFWWKF